MSAPTWAEGVGPNGLEVRRIERGPSGDRFAIVTPGFRYRFPSSVSGEIGDPTVPVTEYLFSHPRAAYFLPSTNGDTIAPTDGDYPEVAVADGARAWWGTITFAPKFGEPLIVAAAYHNSWDALYPDAGTSAMLVQRATWPLAAMHLEISGAEDEVYTAEIVRRAFTADVPFVWDAARGAHFVSWESLADVAIEVDETTYASAGAMEYEHCALLAAALDRRGELTRASTGKALVASRMDYLPDGLLVAFRDGAGEPVTGVDLVAAIAGRRHTLASYTYVIPAAGSIAATVADVPPMSDFIVAGPDVSMIAATPINALAGLPAGRSPIAAPRFLPVTSWGRSDILPAAATIPQTQYSDEGAVFRPFVSLADTAGSYLDGGVRYAYSDVMPAGTYRIQRATILPDDEGNYDARVVIAADDEHDFASCVGLMIYNDAGAGDEVALPLLDGGDGDTILVARTGDEAVAAIELDGPERPFPAGDALAITFTGRVIHASLLTDAADRIRIGIVGEGRSVEVATDGPLFSGTLDFSGLPAGTYRVLAHRRSHVVGASWLYDMVEVILV